MVPALLGSLGTAEPMSWTGRLGVLPSLIFGWHWHWHPVKAGKFVMRARESKEYIGAEQGCVGCGYIEGCEVNL